MPRPGLRLQILLSLLAALVVGLGLVYAFSSKVQESTLREERARQGQQLAAVVADAIDRAAAEDATLDELSGLLVRIADRAGASGATLLDLTGEPIVGVGVAPTPAELREMGSSDTPAATYLDSPTGERLLVTAPIHADALTPRPDRLLLVLSTTHIRDRIEVTDRLVVLFAGVVLLFIVVLSHLLLTRAVVVPVRKVIRSMERFEPTEGDGSPRTVLEYGPALPDRGGSEVELLSVAFTRLTSRLKDYSLRHQVQLREAQALNKRLQQAHESLVRSEKLASVGLLTAGIAHEIGNPVSIILGYLELLQRPDTTADEQRDYVAQIESATQRVNQIIRDLLDFSRPSQGETTEADVCDVARRSLKLLAPQKRFRRVRVTCDCEEDRILARIDDGRLQQVLVNLLMNAGDAMGGTGDVALTVRRRSARVLIEVRDAGPGIPHEHLSRIFDPFFTTKGPGAGTGLGLSICHTIIAAFGGDITVESEQGRGTAFTIDLAEAPVTEAAEPA